MRTHSVVIIGGGVAGLSAAHELIERGFEVDVYEARPALGGKAQSQYVSGTGTQGRRDLPGEHGFRFFPAFYRHVIDTMRRIPCGSGTVKDNLRGSSEAGLALSDDEPVAKFLRRLPSTPSELADSIVLGFGRLGVSPSDSLRFSERVMRYYTSCAQRRLHEYEPISWWDYLQGDRYSPSFQRYLQAIPRTMVAMDARRGSARTIGDISMQLLVDYGGDGNETDRLLCGPTTETWIEPWRAYLSARGVRFHMDSRVHRIHVRERSIAGIQLEDGRIALGEQYILAVPLEALRPLLTADLAALDPALSRLRHLPAARFDELTSWMNGIQFYLRRDVPVVRGHVFYPDAPWALTSISQPQFWASDCAFESRYGNGSVNGLISVDISDFFTPGIVVRKAARDCTPEEVAREVWHQLRAGVNSRQGELLRDDDLVTWHLDDDLVPNAQGLSNRSRLLVHPPGSWRYRPEAASAIDNLTFAADYVRTHTDLATMEGANEAARRAVNAILDRVESPHARCEVWALREPAVFARAKQLDELMFTGRHALDRLGGASGGLDGLTSAFGRLLRGAA